MLRWTKNLSSVSVIELLLAVTIFSMVFVLMMESVTTSYRAVSYDRRYLQALFQAQEGLEAVRSIRDHSWNDLSPGTYGIDRPSNAWELVPNPQEVNGYTRTIDINEVRRDGNGNISESGTTLDSDVYKVTSTINWDWVPGQNREVVLSTYLANVR